MGDASRTLERVLAEQQRLAGEVAQLRAELDALKLRPVARASADAPTWQPGRVTNPTEGPRVISAEAQPLASPPADELHAVHSRILDRYPQLRATRPHHLSIANWERQHFEDFRYAYPRIGRFWKAEKVDPERGPVQWLDLLHNSSMDAGETPISIWGTAFIAACIARGVIVELPQADGAIASTRFALAKEPPAPAAKKIGERAEPLRVELMPGRGWEPGVFARHDRVVG